LKNSNQKPSLFKASSDIEEKTYIVNKIKELINLGEKINEISIIVRSNKEVEQYNNLLEQN
jgi:superfamily I DNA/RNA helicase